MTKRGLVVLLWVAPLAVVGAGLAWDEMTPVSRPLPGADGLRLQESYFDAKGALDLLAQLEALGPRREEEARKKGAAIVEAHAAGWHASRVEAYAFDAPEKDDLRGFNVVATYPGEGPHAKERIVVIGHHDTVPGSPGALDNAAGVALLAGLGPALARRPLGRTVVLAAVDLEEFGLFGAEAVARRQGVTPKGGPVRVAISTEMLGWKHGIPVFHSFPRGFKNPDRRPPAGGLAPRWLARLALRVGRANDRPVSFGDPLISPLYQVVFHHYITDFDSDSGAFARRGVPALFFSDCSFARFYPEYHQPSDRLDQVDPDRFAAAGRSLEAFVLALAHRDALPRTDEEVQEAETGYLAIGRWVLPSWALRWAAIVAPLAMIVASIGAVRSPREELFVMLLGLGTAPVAFAAPVTAFALLVPSWLAAPGMHSRRSWLRRLGAALTLAPPLGFLAVAAGAMATFRAFVVPVHDVGELLVALMLPLGLLLVVGPGRSAPADPA